jgi:hypothetical protein
VSIESLVKEIQSSTSHDLERISTRVQEEFAAAKTSEERAQVLAIFTARADHFERGLEAQGHDEMVAQLRAANAYVYKSLVYQECMVGLDTPVVGADVSVEMLMAVTNREIAAGRMTEEHSVRKAAVRCAAAPHASHAELLARHAKLKEAGASQAEAARKPDKAAHAYAFGSVVGRKLKGLFRR